MGAAQHETGWETVISEVQRQHFIGCGRRSDHASEGELGARMCSGSCMLIVIGLRLPFHKLAHTCSRPRQSSGCGLLKPTHACGQMTVKMPPTTPNSLHTTAPGAALALLEIVRLVSTPLA